MSPNATFEGFFPAAPSVQQQKRKRAALERERLEAAAIGGIVNGASAATEKDVSMKPGIHHAKRQRLSSQSSPDDYSKVNGDSGDLLNGVGSASSHKSTASSVFSQNGATRNGANDGSYTQTPLTVPEASPTGRSTPHSTKTPDAANTTSDMNMNVNVSAGGDLESHEMKTGPSSSASIARPKARPGPGEKKGEKAVYDPTLDRNLNKEQRKNPHLKTRYIKFGEKVRLIHLLYKPIWAERVARADYLFTRKPRHPQIHDCRCRAIEMVNSSHLSSHRSRCGRPSPDRRRTFCRSIPG